MIQSIFRMYKCKKQNLISIYRVRKQVVTIDLPYACCVPPLLSKHGVFKDGGVLYREMMDEMEREE